MNHCVRNTTAWRSVFEQLKNSEMTFLIIVSLKSRMENSIIQELSAETDRIIGNKLLPALSRERYAQVYKLFIEWQNEKETFFVLRGNPHCVFQWKNSYPYLHKACLISWLNLFMKHFKFVSWQSGGPWAPPRLRFRPPRLPSPVTTLVGNDQTLHFLREGPGDPVIGNRYFLKLSLK